MQLLFWPIRWLLQIQYEADRFGFHEFTGSRPCALFWLHLQLKPVRYRNHTDGFLGDTLRLLKDCTATGRLEWAGGDIYRMARILCPKKYCGFYRTLATSNVAIRSRSACLSSHKNSLCEVLKAAVKNI